MPRHSAPGYPDCWIDCPAGGYASYLQPFGPCRRSCDTEDLKNALAEYIHLLGWQARSSASVRGITRRGLRILAQHLKSGPPRGPAIDDVLDDLERIGMTREDETVDATWDKVELREALERLRDAASDSNPGGGTMVAPG